MQFCAFSGFSNFAFPGNNPYLIVAIIHFAKFYFSKNVRNKCFIALKKAKMANLTVFLAIFAPLPSRSAFQSGSVSNNIFCELTEVC